jgi:hypothetical protein
MFLSDHGDYVAAHGLWAKGLPCFREAYQIPLLMKIPGVRGGGRIDSLVSITDVAPTILDIVGLEPFAQGAILCFLFWKTRKSLGELNSFPKPMGMKCMESKDLSGIHPGSMCSTPSIMMSYMIFKMIR